MILFSFARAVVKWQRSPGDWNAQESDVVKHVVFHHVGLLFNEPPGMTGLLFS
jgi:hypothetical protein